jgi:hypothetical protein
VALVDLRTGSCRDGLHPDRANENCGGESVVCYLLSRAEIRQLARVNTGLTKAAARRTVGAPVLPPTQAIRGHLATSLLPESAGALSSA